jgi:hypothetical protein
VRKCTLYHRVSTFSFLDPEACYPLPRGFNFREYIEIEREFWALFPGTDGRRVNFCQLGLTAQLFVESRDDGSELDPDETYFLMPWPDLMLRPLRMRAFRRLNLNEFRMTHLTALKFAGIMDETARIMEAVHLTILGPEVAREAGWS